jgi:hypothetical protein
MNNLDLLQVYAFDKKCRLGSNCDGGYVIAELDGDYDCYISAGVSDEESFSRDFINKYDMNKYNSFAFDGMIQSFPYNYTNNITFFRKNISDVNSDIYTDLSNLTNVYDDIFLKMDIEGGEYKWLASLSIERLKKFKQIAIELHDINDSKYNGEYEDKINCLKKLVSTHYIVHAHGNNACFLHELDSIQYPDVIELTLVNKAYFKIKPELNTKPLPVPNLDFPNVSYNPEIDLNFYPFVKLV